ncbi:hypothetical protein OIU34_21710 [Pararhizobium sp. BT-229]|uniref:hypothetical protein n=1 Tax=Pararhizobium sp. BT-229 TaxID=2986923 RepID=UPI0021F72845|nr:hypothetical protein [Pararhizobium sp. BT-229]MCV9964510.1 hypothetical protein [Pararhizobium sp. BT-229]
MFTYVFYIGGMVIVGAVICSVLSMGYRDAPGWVRGKAGMTTLAVLCCVTMIGLPYAGWCQAARYKDITRRNNAFAALEADIFKMDFNGQCTFNGHMTSPHIPATNSFPCIQRGNIRAVSNPFHTGLTYYVVDRGGSPERWKGMVDYPIPFSFPQERKLLDPERVRLTFMTVETDANKAPITAADQTPSAARSASNSIDGTPN